MQKEWFVFLLMKIKIAVLNPGTFSRCKQFNVNKRPNMIDLTLQFNIHNKSLHLICAITCRPASILDTALIHVKKSMHQISL